MLAFTLTSVPSLPFVPLHVPAAEIQGTDIKMIKKQSCDYNWTAL